MPKTCLLAPFITPNLEGLSLLGDEVVAVLWAELETKSMGNGLSILKLRSFKFLRYG
jgi:hypothetical protein